MSYLKFSSRLVAKLVVVGFEIKLNPADMMLGGVRMGDLLAQDDGDEKHFIGRNLIGTDDHRNMFFRFPVSGLKLFANVCRDFASFCL
jgi:hypothetical protein